MVLPVEFQHVKQNQIVDDGCLLFIPSKTVSQQVYLPSFKCFFTSFSRQDVSNSSFKRVAVVEYFFNIIYKVHCSVGEGEGRHVGQKRTYRKVSRICRSF
jgi:hypothetical protein